MLSYMSSSRPLESAESQHSMPRILVLDDEPLISMMIEDWLAELGCETVGPVHSVRDALGLIGSVAIDGAILDVSLGAEDCYPVADRLRELGVPIAFATGYGPGSIAARFKGELILLKPFDFEAVSEIIAKLVGNYTRT
jgi:CheY-like chemotaxis protein